MANINIPDSALFQAGGGPDLKLTHDGTNSTISNATGTLTINNIANSSMILGTNNTAAVTITSEGRVQHTSAIANSCFDIANTHADGYGAHIQAGSGTKYSLVVKDKDNNERFTVLGNGNTTVAGAVTATSFTANSATPSILMTETDTDPDSECRLVNGGGNLYIDGDLNDEIDNSFMVFRLDNGSEKMRISSDGQVKIAGSVANQLLYVEQDNTSNEAVRIYGPPATSATIPILNVMTNNGVDAELTGFSLP